MHFRLPVYVQDIDTIVETVAQIAGSFGGINLEDISAPSCFEIEERLKDDWIFRYFTMISMERLLLFSLESLMH